MKRMNKTLMVLLTASCLALTGLTACGHMPDMKTGANAFKAGDYDTAYMHYSELSEFGIPRAKIELGKLYLYGRGNTQTDPQKALELFREADAGGEHTLAARYIPRAETKLGTLALKGRISGYSSADALAMLRKAADAGSADALFELGKAYEKGKGVAINGKLADQYYALSTAQGFARAAFYRGHMHMNGKVVTQNAPLAIELYEKSAEMGYDRAYEELAQIYAKGQGVPADLSKAEEYQRLARL